MVGLMHLSMHLNIRDMHTTNGTAVNGDLPDRNDSPGLGYGGALH
jgi:hypothetical protein